MESLTKTVLTNLFETRKDMFGEISTYEDFEMEKTSIWDGCNSKAIFGRILYIAQGKRCYSPPLVIKFMPEIKLTEFYLPFVFLNEIFFYTTVLPIFDKYGPAGDLFPKFYHSCMSFGKHSEAAIVFQNLYPEYRPAEMKAYLDYQHVSLMVRKLAEFHAYSFEVKKQMPEQYRSLVNAFTETHFTVTGELIGFIGAVAIRGVQSLVNNPRYRDKAVKISNMIRSADQIIVNLFTGEKDNPMSVLCHGDYLGKNVMFRYENDKPVDMKIVDMASCKSSSLAVDLALVLYMNTDQNLRDKYFDRLIDEYCETLREIFPKNKTVPDKQYVEEELKTKAFYAYLIASYYQAHLLACDNSLPTFYDLLSENSHEELTVELHTKIGLRVGGVLGTQSLTNILTDMIARDFI